MNLLEIKDLKANIHDKEVLKGISLNIGYGQIHVIMGPNGSGKSSLSKVIAGHPDYTVSSGAMNFEINNKMKNLLEIPVDERSRDGVFLSFQYPVEVAGVSNTEFLRAAFNSVCEHQGVDILDSEDFNELLQVKYKELGFGEEFHKRQVNVGFSGGEKKRNEIIQMAVLSPRLAILDEIDSGLDVDSLKQVAKALNFLKDPSRSMLIITHYNRILEFIKPDFVHVLSAGKIICSGDHSLATRIEAEGYDSVIGEFHGQK